MSLQRICWRRSLWQLPSSCRSISQAAARRPFNDERGREAFSVPQLWSAEDAKYAEEHGVHDRREKDNNMKRLYSPTGFDIAYRQYQESILRGLNARIAERDFEGDVKAIALKTAREPTEAAVFNHASMAFNNHFFFTGIAALPGQQMDTTLQEALSKDFGSIDNLKAEMLAMAEAMFGPGFVWLVRVDGASGGGKQFKLLSTYMAGSPFAGAHNRRQPVDMNTQNVNHAIAAGGVEALSKSHGLTQQHLVPQNSVGGFGQYSKPTFNETLAYGGVNVTPVLCVSTWEHSYMYDWRFNKRHFFERWWSFINWERVNTLADVQSDRNERRTFERASMPRRPYGRR